MVADNNWFNYCFIGFFPSLEENWQNVESHIRALECYCRHVESIDIGDTETSLRYTCRKNCLDEKKREAFRIQTLLSMSHATGCVVWLRLKLWLVGLYRINHLFAVDYRGVSGWRQKQSLSYFTLSRVPHACISWADCKHFSCFNPSRSDLFLMFSIGFGAGFFFSAEMNTLVIYCMKMERT